MSDRPTPDTKKQNPSPRRFAGAAKESRQFEGELKEIELQLERSKLREAEAEAAKKEQEASKLAAEAATARAEAKTAKAEASEAQDRADKEPARQTQALTAGWVRIVLTVIAFSLTVALVIIGLKVEQLWAYPSAVLTGGCLYPLRPWEFVASPENDSDSAG